jgi:hypothetical protein
MNRVLEHFINPCTPFLAMACVGGTTGIHATSHRPKTRPKPQPDLSRGVLKA